MSTDPRYFASATSSADYGWAVTPSDTVDQPRLTREVRATVGGVVMWHNRDGELQRATFADGEARAIRAKRILATGTTATGLEALA